MTDETKPGLVGGLKARWQALQAEHAWIGHVLAAYAQLTRANGNQYAAAITYFSFLALFPLVLLAVSVAGYVLIKNPDPQTKLFAHVTDQVPGKFGTTIKDLLQTAIDNRNSVGVVGLVGVLLTGLGWIGNLRQAIDAVWGHQAPKKNFILSRVTNLVVLGGLGLGIVVSLGLTAVGTSLTSQILKAVGLDDVPGSTFVLKILGIAIAVIGDMIIFWWVLVRLPGVEVASKTALRGVLMAGIGFEILKIVGTYTIAHASQSKTAGPFASVIAVLVWIQLVSRFMLFCCAWMTTADDAKRTANSIPVIEPEVMVGPEEPEFTVHPATVGATLVGVGAIAGAVATYLSQRPFTRSRPDPD